MNRKSNFFFFVFLFFSRQLFCQEDCDLKKSQDSIFVYTCKHADSRLKSIKANFSIKTKLSVLAGSLLDVPNYTSWQYKTIEATVLKKISDNEIIYRSEIEAPWPVSNRDLVMHLKVTQDTITRKLIISLKSMPDFVTEKVDVVRVPHAEGQWIIEAGKNDELLIRYNFLIDPGGSVPVWLINLALADGPYETFRDLIGRINSGVKIVPAFFIAD